MVVEKGYILGGRGKFWEDRIKLLKRGYILEGRDILGGSHIVVKRRGVYSGREG